jgi:hypothetical protein
MAYADQLNEFDTNSKITQKRPLDDNIYCMMDNTWKLIYRIHHPEANELFNVVADPDEVKNLNAENLSESERLFAILKSFKPVPFRVEPFAPDGSAQSPDTLKRLINMGYIDKAPTPDASDVGERAPMPTSQSTQGHGDGSKDDQSSENDDDEGDGGP